jgi:hypothetical protein
MCPLCDDDIEDWWFDAMDSAAETKFSNLETTTPCCGKGVSLNRLNYVRPVGFAKFVLDAMNPDEADLPPEQLRQLEKCLGCELRTIWRHL